jgi:hypothetical protein
MRARILALPKRRKTRAQWQRPELLLVQVDLLGEEVELALLYDRKLKAAAMA